MADRSCGSFVPRACRGAGTRAFGYSKDHRADLPRVVIAMAVTRDGVPVRCWTFPGDTADTAIIRTITDVLNGWGLRRLVWVADRGFACAANRGYLTRGGGHYIHAEKLRHTNTEATAALARAGRYRTVGDNPRVKEVAVAPGTGTRQRCSDQRFVICHNPEQGERDQQVRATLAAHLQQLITGSDGWTARRRDEFVGTSDLTLTPDDLAAAYNNSWPSNAAGATSQAPSGCARCSTTAALTARAAASS